MSPAEALVLESIITCPECGCRSPEQMPTDACLWFHECRACKDTDQAPEGRLLRVLQLRNSEVSTGAAFQFVLRDRNTSH
jgi:hypothetical protein